MPRAHRHYVPELIWHVTQRCHDQKFLLKFARDRDRWRHWLHEACERYGLCVLDYIVTSNHIHLLVRDRGKDEIASSMQLVSGRIAQEFNERRSRRGAFWDGRYHATAVESGKHLANCIVYIDLNMVRAGAIAHPGDWTHCGYREIQKPPRYKAVIDTDALVAVLGVASAAELQRRHREWIECALRAGTCRRDERWTEGIAVGSPEFVERVQRQLGVRVLGRRVELQDDVATLREASGGYDLDLTS